MLVNKEKFRLSIAEAVSLLGAVLYLIGIRVWFPTCAVTGDTVMSCHWAGQMLKAVSILVTVLSAVHILLPDYKLKAGIDLSMIGICILTLNIPGRIISLCVKEGMSCRTKTMTWTIIFCAVLLLLYAADAFLCLSRAADEKHRRKS